MGMDAIRGGLCIAFATVHGNWWLTAIGWAAMVGWLLVYTKSLGACIVGRMRRRICCWRYMCCGFMSGHSGNSENSSSDDRRHLGAMPTLAWAWIAAEEHGHASVAMAPDTIRIAFDSVLSF